MNKQKQSKTSLFLMEIILNILFFTILVTMCLQLFFKAHTLSESSITLHKAVTTCTSIAEIYQSNVNGTESVFAVYPDAIGLNQNILIFFDEDFNPCTESRCTYRAAITVSNTQNKAETITFSDHEGANMIYTLSVSSYEPRTLGELSGGAAQ